MHKRLKAVAICCFTCGLRWEVQPYPLPCTELAEGASPWPGMGAAAVNSGMKGCMEGGSIPANSGGIGASVGGWGGRTRAVGQETKRSEVFVMARGNME